MAPKRGRFADHRKACGYSQEALAHHLGVERSTVVRWENGATSPQPWVRTELARQLDLTLDQLRALLVEESQDEHPLQPWLRPQDDDMRRRELLHLFSLAGTMLALPPIEDSIDGNRVAEAAIRPGSLDAGVLTDYTNLNGHLWRTFALTSVKTETMPLVRGQLDVLTEHLRQPHTDTDHRTLCVLTADLFQLAGEIFFDANRYADAAHCYTLASTAGNEADAYDLWACALTRHAFLSVYERQFSQAQSLLDAAGRLTAHGDPGLSTRYWVYAVQAHTLAGLGDLRACQDALNRAEEVRGLDGEIHNAGWLRFDGTRLPEERGACYIELGRPDLAETALNTALNQDLSPRRSASVLTDLAILGAQRRDPDRVLSYADTALEAARTTGSGVIGHKLGELRNHLAPFASNPRIHQLDHDIARLETPSLAV